MVSNTQRSVTQTRCLVWSQFNSTYSLWEVIDWSQHRTRALQCSKSVKPYRTRRTGFRYCKEYLWISMLHTTNLSPDRPSCRRSQGLYESAAVYPKVLVVQSLAPRAAHVNFVMMASQRFWASFIKQVLLIIWWDFIRKMLIMRRIQHGIYLRLRLFTILIGYRMFIRRFFFSPRRLLHFRGLQSYQILQLQSINPRTIVFKGIARRIPSSIAKSLSKARMGNHWGSFRVNVQEYHFFLLRFTNCAIPVHDNKPFANNVQQRPF